MSEHVAKIHTKRAARTRRGMSFDEIVRKEIDELHTAVNDERHTLDNICCSLLDVERIERSCAGHVDYAHKLGLRLQELVDDIDHGE